MGEAPAFPKLIYVLEEDNIDEGSSVFLSDGACGKMYVKTSCSGLYFREKDERTKRRKLLPGYGMPKRS